MRLMVTLNDIMVMEDITGIMIGIEAEREMRLKLPKNHQGDNQILEQF